MPRNQKIWFGDLKFVFLALFGKICLGKETIKLGLKIKWR